MRRERMQRWQRLDGARVSPFLRRRLETRATGTEAHDKDHGRHERGDDPRARANASRKKPREKRPIEYARDVGHAIQPTAALRREFRAMLALESGSVGRNRYDGDGGPALAYRFERFEERA
jgi:hypothetical protein